MTLQQEYMERYEEGLIEGEERGCVKGRLEGKIEILSQELHMTSSQIADKLSLPESEVLRILEELQKPDVKA